MSIAKRIAVVSLSAVIALCLSITIAGSTAFAASDSSGAAKTKSAESSKKTGKSSKKPYRDGLAAYIRKVNPHVSKKKSKSMAGYFIKYGKKYKVSPRILMAMAQCESTFYSNAHNPAGYYGLMQTSASLGRRYAHVSSHKLYNPKYSIKTGAAYLHSNMKIFKNNYKKAISGYCYGSGAVKAGRYRSGHANRRIGISKKIKKYLKKHNYATGS